MPRMIRHPFTASLVVRNTLIILGILTIAILMVAAPLGAAQASVRLSRREAQESTEPLPTPSEEPKEGDMEPTRFRFGGSVPQVDVGKMDLYFDSECLEWMQFEYRPNELGEGLLTPGACLRLRGSGIASADVEFNAKFLGGCAWYRDLSCNKLGGPIYNDGQCMAMYHARAYKCKIVNDSDP